MFRLAIDLKKKKKTTLTKEQSSEKESWPKEDGVPRVTPQRWDVGKGKETEGKHSFWAKRGFQLVYHQEVLYEAAPLCRQLCKAVSCEFLM